LIDARCCTAPHIAYSDSLYFKAGPVAAGRISGLTNWTVTRYRIATVPRRARHYLAGDYRGKATAIWGSNFTPLAANATGDIRTKLMKNYREPPNTLGHQLVPNVR